MPDEEQINAAPEFYIDGYTIEAHQYTIQVTFTLVRPHQEEPTPIAVVRMSPEHAKVMAILFKRNVKDWETQLGVEIAIPPQVVETHGIDLERDW